MCVMCHVFCVACHELSAASCELGVVCSVAMCGVVLRVACWFGCWLLLLLSDTFGVCVCVCVFCVF